MAQRLRQARNANAPYLIPIRSAAERIDAWPLRVGERHITRALSILEEGSGLALIPASHRTHMVAGAFMALTGAALQEVEQECGRIKHTLTAMGWVDWQIAALVIDSVKQCHYRLACRTMTMTQLASHAINCGARQIVCREHDMTTSEPPSRSQLPQASPPSEWSRSRGRSAATWLLGDLIRDPQRALQPSPPLATMPATSPAASSHDQR